MHGRILVTGVLAGLLALPGYSSAESRARFLNDGKPVQVHIHAPAHDLSHEEDKLQDSLPQASPGPLDDGKTQASTAGFQIPLRRGLSNNIPNVLTIAAFVDHDAAFPDSLLDWNCGERTYDTDSINHNGTDYNGAQFPWLTMANDGMIVIAAADGVIIDKHDGEPDQNCSFTNPEPNQVTLEHTDGSVTLYAHIKKGTVTPRKIGDRVEQGDFLGVMGSSGFSQGPHLHFGVYDSSGGLLDPYAGACNSLNNNSLWEDQEAYLTKQILSVATHDAAPERPPCPQQETPNFQNVFAAADTIFASVDVRDIEVGDQITATVLGPSGQQIISAPYTHTVPGQFAGYSITLSFTLGSSPQAGKYTWRVSFDGETMEHFFYVGPGPTPAAGAVTANNAYAGLWYDSLFDGEGFNIVTSSAGTVVYYYGSDDRGNRLWLISDLVTGVIKPGQTIETLMFESSGGVFSTPVPSARGLSIWGTLQLTFNACSAGQSTLTGVDGVKVSNIVKLAGVSGATCVEGDVPADAPWAGLWYDSGKDGEGYNLIISPVGRILYFYGFKASGLRAWFVSDVINQALAVGVTVTTTLYESTQGTFASPVPSGQALVAWGTAKITVVNCNTMTIVIEGTDGKKTSSTVRLAGIIGTNCSN